MDACGNSRRKRGMKKLPVLSAVKAAVEKIEITMAQKNAGHQRRNQDMLSVPQRKVSDDMKAGQKTAHYSSL